jgi:hypothetical protein
VPYYRVPKIVEFTGDPTSIYVQPDGTVVVNPKLLNFVYDCDVEHRLVDDTQDTYTTVETHDGEVPTNALCEIHPEDPVVTTAVAHDAKNIDNKEAQTISDWRPANYRSCDQEKSEIQKALNG